MPEQHQDFYSKLRLLWLSLRDKHGRPTVLALSGAEGFIQVPSENELLIVPHQDIDPGKASFPLACPSWRGLLCTLANIVPLFQGCFTPSGRCVHGTMHAQAALQALAMA